MTELERHIKLNLKDITWNAVLDDNCKAHKSITVTVQVNWLLCEPLLPPSRVFQTPTIATVQFLLLPTFVSSNCCSQVLLSFPSTARISFRVISQECLTCAQYIPPSSAPWSVYDEATVRRQANVDLSRAAPAPLCSLVRFLYNRCTVYDTRTLIELCFVRCRHRCEVGVTALLFGLCLTLSPSSPPLLWMLPM